MNRAILVSAMLTLIVAPLYAQSTAMFNATLRGSAEAPGPGDPDGEGTGVILFNSDRSMAIVEIEVDAIGTNFAGAHIHEGAIGVPGPIVINITAAGAFSMEGRLRTSLTVDPATADAIIANPAAFYLNVHTTEFPGGAIRGQLAPVARSLRTSLSGGAEPGGGDTNGSGNATVVFSSGHEQAFIDVSVINVDGITMAHIHRGAAGVIGPPVVSITSVDDTFVDGSISVLRDVDPDLAAEILSNPAGFYVNVHSTAFPDGAVRGQLAERPVADANGDGTVSVTDIFFLINFFFGGGPAPE